MSIQDSKSTLPGVESCFIEDGPYAGKYYVAKSPPFCFRVAKFRETKAHWAGSNYLPKSDLPYEEITYERQMHYSLDDSPFSTYCTIEKASEYRKEWKRKNEMRYHLLQAKSHLDQLEKLCQQ